MSRNAIALLCLLPLAGCGPVTIGSGTVTTETRYLEDDIHEVGLAGTGDLTIEFGDTPRIEIESDDNILPLVETKESNGSLTIRVKGNVSPTHGVTYRLIVRSLDGLSVSGSGSATVVRWVGGEGKVKISGSGDVLMTESHLSSLTAKLSGSGTLTASGRAEKVEYTISGSGTVHADGLQSAEVEAKISGSGSAEVWADRKLDAQISGSGSVTYIGNPSIHKKLHGSGSVEPAR